MSQQFASQYAIDPAAGFDAGQLKGKSVIVTGGLWRPDVSSEADMLIIAGASGLGEEMVKQFVKAGLVQQTTVLNRLFSLDSVVAHL